MLLLTEACPTDDALTAALYLFPGAWLGRIGSIGAVAPGAKLFSGKHLVLQSSVNLRAEQPDGAGSLKGLANLVEFTGATTPRAGAAPLNAAKKVSLQHSTTGNMAGQRGSISELAACCMSVVQGGLVAKVRAFCFR